MGYDWAGPDGGVDAMGKPFTFKHDRCCWHGSSPAECAWDRPDGPCCPHCTAKPKAVLPRGNLRAARGLLSANEGVPK